MRGGIIALLLMLSPSASAAHGAWSATAAGPMLSVGRQAYAGQPLRPHGALPADARVSRISWRISLLAPPPPGLEIKLCSAAACIALDRLAGQRTVKQPFAPGAAFRFVYQVNTTGELRPPVQVVSNQLTVNYQWAIPAGH